MSGSTDGSQTDESSQKLFDALDFQRAYQAYIWSTTLVSFYTWLIEQTKVYETREVGEFAVLVSLKEKRGIVRGEPDHTLYLFIL